MSHLGDVGYITQQALQCLQSELYLRCQGPLRVCEDGRWHYQFQQSQLVLDHGQGRRRAGVFAAADVLEVLRAPTQRLSDGTF